MRGRKWGRGRQGKGGINPISSPVLNSRNAHPRVQKAARDFGLDGVDFASCGRCS